MCRPGPQLPIPVSQSVIELDQRAARVRVRKRFGPMLWHGSRKSAQPRWPPDTRSPPASALAGMYECDLAGWMASILVGSYCPTQRRSAGDQAWGASSVRLGLPPRLLNRLSSRSAGCGRSSLVEQGRRAAAGLSAAGSCVADELCGGRSRSAICGSRRSSCRSGSVRFVAQRSCRRRW
jgi:hypothetical protein